MHRDIYILQCLLTRVVRVLRAVYLAAAEEEYSPQRSGGEGVDENGGGGGDIDPVEQTVQEKLISAQLDEPCMDAAFLEALAGLGNQYADSASKLESMQRSQAAASKISNYYANLYVAPTHGQALKQALEETHLDECPFRPTISARSARLASARTHGDLERASTATSAARRTRAAGHASSSTAADETLTFRPTINRVSARIAEHDEARSNLPRTDRMYRLGLEWQERREARRRRAYGTPGSACPFTPTISRRALEEDTRPFPERASEWLETREAHRRAVAGQSLAARDVEDEQNCTFRPRLLRRTSVDGHQQRPDTPPGTDAFVARYRSAQQARLEREKLTGSECRTARAATRAGADSGDSNDAHGLSRNSSRLLDASSGGAVRHSQRAVRPEPFDLGTVDPKRKAQVRRVVAPPLSYRPVLSVGVLEGAARRAKGGKRAPAARERSDSFEYDSSS